MCCAMLSDERDKENCQEAVEEDDARDCGRASERFCASSEPTDAACSALASCCSMLQDEDDKEDCDEVVEEDDARDCMQAHERFCM